MKSDTFYFLIFFILINSNLFGQKNDSLKVFENQHWKFINGWFGDDSIILLPRENIDTTGFYKLSNLEIYNIYIKNSFNLNLEKLNNLSKKDLSKLYFHANRKTNYGDHLFSENDSIIYHYYTDCPVGEIEKIIKNFIVIKDHLYITYTIGIYDSEHKTEYKQIYDIYEWNEKRIILTLCRKE